MSNRAVLYLRSSKDRTDVSIDAQRRALHEMAATRSLVVVGEYVDAVESGKDDDRPGFQSMLFDLKQPAREWDVVLALDTSRIARRRTISMIFEEQECRRKGVRVLYKSIPDSDPVTEMLLKSILQAMDEWLSLTSKAKGLAGMAENVRQGWRAGGRAPRGYALEYIPTGAIRDGVPVTKSRLVATDELATVGAYLAARADGATRGEVLRRLGVSWPVTSLIGMEWQALTYAGHTVWNIHAERDNGIAIGGTKRRPRAEWLVKRSTHEAIITDDQAEAIFTRLESGRERYTRPKAREYLLSGLLVDADGNAWHGDHGDAYRLGKAKKISAARIEGTVLDRVAADLQAPASVARIADAVRRAARTPTDAKRIPTLERAIAAATTKVGRLVDIVAKTDDPTPFLRRVTELETEREGLIDELQRVRGAVASVRTMNRITDADVRAMLATLLDEVRAQRESGATRPLREALAGMIERIELDATASRCVIHYRIAAPIEGGVSLASPGGTAASHPIRWDSEAPMRARWTA